MIYILRRGTQLVRANTTNVYAISNDAFYLDRLQRWTYCSSEASSHYFLTKGQIILPPYKRSSSGSSSTSPSAVVFSHVLCSISQIHQTLHQLTHPWVYQVHPCTPLFSEAWFKAVLIRCQALTSSSTAAQTKHWSLTPAAACVFALPEFNPEMPRFPNLPSSPIPIEETDMGLGGSVM